MEKDNIDNNVSGTEEVLKLNKDIINALIQKIFIYIPIILLGIYSILIWFILNEPIGSVLIIDIGNVYSLAKGGELLEPVKSLYVVISFAGISVLLFLISMHQMVYNKKVFIKGKECEKSLITVLISQLVYVFFIVAAFVINGELKKEDITAGTCSKYMLILSSVTLFTSLMSLIGPKLLNYNKRPKTLKELLIDNADKIKKVIKYAVIVAIIGGSSFAAIRYVNKNLNSIFQTRKIKDFVVNETTKEEVIKELGKPHNEEENYIEYFSDQYLKVRNKINKLNEGSLSDLSKLVQLSEKLYEMDYKYIYISFSPVTDEFGNEVNVLKEIVLDTNRNDSKNNYKTYGADDIHLIGKYYASTYNTAPIYPQMFFDDGSYYYAEKCIYSVTDITYSITNELRVTYSWTNDFFSSNNYLIITLIGDC